jgi:N-acetylmuramoyl-L-alanine amidase
MDKKIRKISMIAMVILTVAVCGTVVQVSQQFTTEQTRNATMIRQGRVSGLELMEYYSQQQLESNEEPVEHHMQLELPRGVAADEIKVKNDYLHMQITLTIPSMKQDYFSQHPILGKSNYIDDLFFWSSEGVGIIEITMDSVYEVEMLVNDSWLYVDFVAPQKKYEKVIVIDAGHGGVGAPGAVKQGVLEKDLNLAIVLELKKLLSSHKNWKIYYTRTNDSAPSLDERFQLANKSKADLFISVHNNSTGDGQMIDYEGTVVMYDEQKKVRKFGAKHLAQILLEETVAAAGSRDLGLVHGNSIYILRKSRVPTALVEVGYMTDVDELSRLSSAKYQKKAAKGIYNGIKRAIKEGF